jgi:hypothetical protein
MDIVIPSRGRPHSQESLKQLRAAGLYVTVVVPMAELESYLHHAEDPWVRVVGLPEQIQGIAHKRQWMLENIGTDDAFIMVDDDLTFFKRRTDDPSKLTDISPEELYRAFQELSNVLVGGVAAHAGFAAREGANRQTASRVHNTRIMRVLGYNRAVLRQHNITFGRIPVMEDFDVALRLLRAGYPNLILNNYAHNQKGSGAVGGCSVWRTPQVQAQAAQELAKWHPGYVKVVEKTTKTAWGGGTRTDVTVQWKRAYSGK